MSTAAQQRWDHFDNLRWIAMLWGVFVHTLTLADFGSLEFISAASNTFRMPLFFIVSGFLGAMLFSRRDVSDFLTNRLRNLCIPLIFGVIVLNIPTLWLMDRYRAMADFPEAGADPVWHLHLWFLVSLIAFVCAVPLVSPAMGRLAGWLERMARRFRAIDRNFLIVCFLGILAMEVSIIVVTEGLESLVAPFPWLVKATLRYFPFYVFGMLAFHLQPWRRDLLRIHAGLLVGAAALFLAARLVDLPAGLAVPVDILALFIFRFALCVTLIRLGEVFLSWRNTASAFLSRSIYTVYLLHYGLIYMLGTLYVERFDQIGAIGFWIISLVTIGIGFAVHHVLVERVPFFAFVLNGRLISPKTRGRAA